MAPDLYPSQEELKSGPINPSVQRPSLVPTSERDYVKRYSKFFRASHSAVLKTFSDVQILAPNDELISVPIRFGAPERAVAALVSEASSPDGKIRRVTLPAMALSLLGVEFDQTRFTFHEAWMPKWGGVIDEKRKGDVSLDATRGLPVILSYSLLVWTKYLEDLFQIVEQIILKFSPVSYLHVEGCSFESILKIDSQTTNIEAEVGDDRPRVVKYEFSLSLETHVPQPMRRRKLIHDVRTQMGLGDPTDPGSFVPTSETSSSSEDL